MIITVCQPKAKCFIMNYLSYYPLFLCFCLLNWSFLDTNDLVCWTTEVGKCMPINWFWSNLICKFQGLEDKQWQTLQKRCRNLLAVYFHFDIAILSFPQTITQILGWFKRLCWNWDEWKALNASWCPKATHFQWFFLRECGSSLNICWFVCSF